MSNERIAFIALNAAHHGLFRSKGLYCYLLMSQIHIPTRAVENDLFVAEQIELPGYLVDYLLLALACVRVEILVLRAY